MSTKHLLWLLPAILIAGCDHARMENNGSTAAQANTPTEMVADSTAAIAANKPLNSGERKMIRTADFHCRVDNVFSATTNLEHLVQSVGGIVQDSHMDNNNYDTHTSYYKADSLRQTQTYTPTALLTLRVPAMYLDSVIHAIPGMANFIESRTLKQSDVTYRYLSNELKNKVGTEKGAATRAMELAKKSKDPIDVQEYENDREETRIDRKMENMQLMDDVTYATITVAFSQPEQVFVQTIINPDYYSNPPFSIQCKEALFSGWSFAMAFVLALVNIWPILLLVIVSWIIFRKFRRKNPFLFNRQNAVK